MAACCTLTVTAWPGSSLGALSHPHPTEGDLYFTMIADRWALQRCVHALGAHARLGCPRARALACVCMLPCRCGARAAQTDQQRSRSLCVALCLQEQEGRFDRRESRQWPFAGVSHSP